MSSIHKIDPKQPLLGERVNPTIAARCIVIGQYSESDHEDCIVIGNNLKTTAPRQLVIGNSTVQVSRQMTDEEYQSLYETLRSIVTNLWGAKP